MSKQYTLAANMRDRAGKGVARAIRRELSVPAVIYGDNKPPVMISLPDKELWIEYNKGHMHTNLVELNVGGEKVLALARDIQTHPVTDRIEHVDFMRVGPKTKIAVKVPFHFTNQDKSPGLKAKGILNIVRHELEIRCLAMNIPENLEVDLSSAEVGAMIKIGSIKLPEGGSLLKQAEKDFSVATILPPIVKEVVVAAAPVKGKGKAAKAAPAAKAAAPAAAAAAPAKGGKAAPAAAAKPAGKK